MNYVEVMKPTKETLKSHCPFFYQGKMQVTEAPDRGRNTRRGNRYGVVSTGRPVLRDGREPKGPKKYQRESHSFEKKLHVINDLQTFGMPTVLRKYFAEVTDERRIMSVRKMIYNWAAQRTHIEQSAHESHTRNLKKTRKQGTSATLSNEIEEDILKWICDTRNLGAPVSTLMLQLKALEIAAEQGISTTRFKASRTWVKSYRERWGLAMRMKTRQGQDMDGDGNVACQEFSEHVRRIMIEHSVRKVYNADQTSVFYEYLPKTTIDRRGARTVWVRCGGKDKERATAMLLADSEGTKYPLFLVLKQKKSTVKETVEENNRLRYGFGKKVWKEARSMMGTHNCVIHGNPSAWWNGEISLSFLKYHFSTTEHMDEKVVLLWDDFSGHWTKEVLEYAASINVILCKIPPRFTWVCQTADVAWNKPLKAQLRKLWIQDLKGQIDEFNLNQDAEAFTMTPPDRKKIVHWIHIAWNELSTNIITNGFRKTKLLPLEMGLDETTEDQFEADNEENCTVLRLEALSALAGEITDNIFES